MILVEFYDDLSLINSFITMKSLQPEKVLFFIDHKDYKEEKVNNILFALKAICKNTEANFIKINVNKLYETKDKVIETIKNYNKDIYIGISQGNQISSICGYLVSEENNRVILINNEVENDAIFNLKDHSFISNINHLDILDFFSIVGANRSILSSHSMPLDDEKDQIVKMSEYIFTYGNNWSSLNYKIEDALKDNANSFILNNLDTNEHFLMDKFVELNFVTVNHNVYTLVKQKYYEYLRTYGIWLEMYTYFKVKEIYPETYLGVLIDWNRSDGVSSIDNEIDVVTLHKSTLYFISCKMRMIHSLDLYEVGYLAKRLGGYKAKALMSTTSVVSRDSRLHERMVTMDIGLLRPSYMEEDLQIEFKLKP